MARTVGIIRRLDDLGRITLPKEYRTYLGIKPTDKVEMIARLVIMALIRLSIIISL